MNKQDIPVSVDFADMEQTEIASQADGNYIKNWLLQS